MPKPIKPYPTKLERRAAKKAAQAQINRRHNLGHSAKTMAGWVVGVAALWFVGAWLVTSFSPKGPDLSVAVPILGREHITPGTVYKEYNSNPPSSGPHYPQDAPTGFYTSALPDEQLVHNLEHGQIWISYQPDLPAPALAGLQKLTGDFVIITPRSQNDTDIALTAWGRQDKFNLGPDGLDTQRVSDFILRYQNLGPERLNTPGTHSN